MIHQMSHPQHTAKTQLMEIEISVTAHKDHARSIVLVTVKANEPSESLDRKSVKTALVIDRSGSMAGAKIEITRASAAKFVRSLSSDDQIGVAAYDSRVDLIAGLTSPTEFLARKISELECGGSTNLYGGWLTGAKLVGRGGRVILLSDGQANIGRYQSAESMSEQARISYEKFGVTTTTIGVGRDYDEALMAGMARLGGGAHYFADTTESILQAFSHERFAIDAVALEGVSIKCGPTVEQFGHLWANESKSRVISVNSLSGLEISVRYTSRANGQTNTASVTVPKEFGISHEAVLEHLMAEASRAESEMTKVQDSASALTMKDELRRIVIELLSHPFSDSPPVKEVIERLKASIERLAQLEIQYSDQAANLHRKRSMQTSHNLIERGKAFSAFAEDAVSIKEAAAMADPSSVRSEPVTVDPASIQFAATKEWEKWNVVPLSHTSRQIVIAMENPRDGFLISEIQKATGRKVKAVFTDLTGAEIEELLVRTFKSLGL